MSADRVLCTQFDSQYLARGIAMLRSLRRFDACAAIQVLALDEVCARVLREVFGSRLRLITAAALDDRFPALAALADGRSAWASYATRKPASVVWALDDAPPSSTVAFIDADTWFFSDPAPMFDELGAASIGLSPHRHLPEFRQFDAYGLYNAGCILWRADETGRRCAREWLDDCVRRCDERLASGGSYMNQGYLDRWPERYRGVHILQHPGVNLAPWNVDRHRLAPDGAGVSVDGQPLIFYHFSALVPDAEGGWQSFHVQRHRQLDFLCASVYGPYLAAVEAERESLQRSHGIDGTGSIRHDLAAGRGVQHFYAAGVQAAAGDRPDDIDVEREAHWRALRSLVDARLYDAALMVLRIAGPPPHGAPGEWEYYVAFCLHSLRREPEAALSHYAAARESGYDEYWVCFQRGQLFLDLNRRADAVRDLERALELRPQDAALARVLAKARRPRRWWR